MFFSAFICGHLLTQFSNAFLTQYLGHWASQYDEHDPSEVAVFQYVLIDASYSYVD